GLGRHCGLAHFIPSTGATLACHAFAQPGLDLSQTSAQTGSETLPTALRTRSRSAGVTATLTSLNFLPVVHGSRPALQFSASWNSSSEYFQTSSVRPSKADFSLACCSGLSAFQALSVMP